MTETDKNESSEHTAEIRLENQGAKSQKKHQLIIPYGLLFILILCLTTSTIEWTQSKSPTSKYVEELKHIKTDFPLEKRHQKNLNGEPVILKLLEHPKKCYDLQIFTKQINSYGIKNGLKKINQIENNFKKNERVLKEIERADGAKYFRNAVKRKSNISNERIKKLLNNKNKYNGKNTKSIKTNNFRRKDLDKKDILQKKSTAEPIIYSFALVFIYLLLKAASDINQHYKSQTKGDKRMRRYSLQSYAQVHKPDRRASKIFSSKNVLKS